MAVIPQPTKYPEWNTGGSNRTEPTAGEKVSGWVVDDEPPSSYFNWLSYYTYDWLRWINQRFSRGATEVDLTIIALQPDSSGVGGDLTLKAGAALTAGVGGDAFLSGGAGGSSSGNGGQVGIFAGNGVAATGGRATVEAGDGGLGGGDVRVEGGNASVSGAGGDIDVISGTGRNGASGSINITVPPPVIAGAGGDVTVAAGDAVGSGNAGGDLTLTAGDSVGSGGGDLYAAAGDAAGTDQQGGLVEISTGASTGDRGATVTVNVAEAGTSGSGSNAPQPYFVCNGADTQKFMALNRHVRVENVGDTARGEIRLVPRTVPPTAPVVGDLYTDSTTDQFRYRDAVGYRNLNSFFDQPSIGSFGVNDTVQERAFTHGGGNVAVTIPANYLSVGSIIRCRMTFVRSGTKADEPGFRIRIGTHGTMGADAIAYSVTSRAVTSVLTSFQVECTMYVDASGASGNLATFARALARESSATWVSPQYASESKTTVAIDTTVANEFYPTVYWHAVGAGNQSMTCPRFFVDII